MFPKPKFDRRAPKRGTRGVITKEQYQLALDYFGDSCNNCGGYPIELHHCRFRAQGGRGNWRNLMPLCKKCHIKAHRDRGFADGLRAEREETFGKYYYCDRFDLSEHGHIEESSEVAFEEFMRRESGG